MPSQKYFVFSGHQLLLQNEENSFLLPSADNLPNIVKTNEAYCIGHYHGYDCYAVEAQSLSIREDQSWMPLKAAMECIGTPWYPIAARAYQIIQWDLNHHFCGRCQHETHRITNQFEKRCDQCHLSFFPKISPAIIVLIRKGDQLLMARKKEFPVGAYGLIAGFVEPGETIEETVHREVYEEVGLFVNNVVYVGSQSWPFPDSLMLAFTADYVSGEITAGDGELEHAAWYDVNHIPGRPSSSMSIATAMINDFIKQQTNK